MLLTTSGTTGDALNLKGDTIMATRADERRLANGAAAVGPVATDRQLIYNCGSSPLFCSLHCRDTCLGLVIVLVILLAMLTIVLSISLDKLREPQS